MYPRTCVLSNQITLGPIYTKKVQGKEKNPVPTEISKKPLVAARAPEL